MILQIQKLLNIIFNSKLTEDGILGPKTREAIKIAQQKLGMIVDGNPSSELITKLESQKNGSLVPSNTTSNIKDMIKNNQKTLYLFGGAMAVAVLFAMLRKKSVK